MTSLKKSLQEYKSPTKSNKDIIQSVEDLIFNLCENECLPSVSDWMMIGVKSKKRCLVEMVIRIIDKGFYDLREDVFVVMNDNGFKLDKDSVQIEVLTSYIRIDMQRNPIEYKDYILSIIDNFINNELYLELKESELINN